MVDPKNLSFIYPSCCSKSVWLYFFCEMQKTVFKNLHTALAHTTKAYGDKGLASKGQKRQHSLPSEH